MIEIEKRGGPRSIQRRLRLYKGNAIVEGRESPESLYSLEHVTFEEDTVYDQRDAEGFIKLNALRLRLLNRQKGG